MNERAKPVPCPPRRCIAACLLLSLAISPLAQESAPADERGGSPRIALVRGVRDDGTASELWTQGLAVAIGRERATELSGQRLPLAPDAEAWLQILEAAMPLITERAAGLARVFDVRPMAATVVAGNRGSSDGFGWVPDHVGINLQAFVETYGPPSAGATDRMVRIVAHEYLHLLTYAAYENHRELRQTPPDRALWTIFFEGIGDYVSVSSRWLPDARGNYSTAAAETLERLEPLFVGRLEALANDDGTQEEELRAGIAMGRFDEKWGSLPFALWLHSEATRCGEPQTLQAVFRLERDAVLALASGHAAPPLAARIDALADRLQRPYARASDVSATCLAKRFGH